jgi:uncharacterized membrane protein
MDSLWLLLAVAVIGTPVCAIVAVVKAANNARALGLLSRQIADLRMEFVALRGEQRMPQAAATEPAPPPPMVQTVSEPQRPAEAAYAQAPPQPPPSRPTQTPQRAKPVANLEDALTSRWLVWLGAVAIALGGVFLVKYAIDNQLLTPVARIVLGLLLGLTLIAGGEALRRTPLQRAIVAVRPDYVPPALTASGLFIAFASIYSAYAVYALIGPLVAFVGLAIVAVLGVGLSLLQGQFIALLGLLGAYITPALITTPNPSAWTLFAYLLVVEFACLAVVRYQAWWWLALATLAGSATWPILWMMDAHTRAAGALPMGVYLLLSAGAFFLSRLGLPPTEFRDNWLEEIRESDLSHRAIWIAGCTIAFLLFLTVAYAEYSTSSLVLFGLGIVLYLVAGRWERPFDALSMVMAIATLAVLAAMPLPPDIVAPAPHAAMLPGGIAVFARAAVAFGALFGIGGFIALWGARRPGIWAGVSSGVPVLALAIGYWRIVDFGVDLEWAGIAVALAATALFAAERVERYRAEKELDVSLGLYAAAVVACLSLAAAMALREAWLTVALSLQLPALGAISRRIPVRALRVLAGVVTAIVLARLALNYNILHYDVGRWPGANWIVYGYGIPALACYAAARLFRDDARDFLISGLETAALAFAVLLVSLEIRLFVTGSLDTPHYDLLEESLQSISWLAIGTALAFRGTSNPVARFGSRVLLGAAAAQIVFFQLLISNPLLSSDPVGTNPILNVLSLAYLVPGILAFAFAARARSQAPASVANGAAIAGFVLIFVYISLEVRRAMHGPVLSGDTVSDAELYSYSVVWLIYAGVLLAGGLLLGQRLMRYAALGMLALVSVKVFLIDMGGLTGLYRVASFLGLGGSLVGIGYLYQRFVPRQPT